MKVTKICLVVGTRPEVIKQVPLYWACQKEFGPQNVSLLSTGQHGELTAQALTHFSCQAIDDLRLMLPGQTLNALAGSLLISFDSWLRKNQPDLVIVQGDTSSAAMAAICAFNLKIRVAHNEAGLRSYNLNHPFPEEANRRWISVVADYNFAPTERAKQALLSEGIDKNKIFVTGNTGIDSLFWTLDQKPPPQASEILKDLQSSNLKPVLLTAHRREGSGPSVQIWFETLRSFLDTHLDIALIYPVHPNHLAKEAFDTHLANHPRVKLYPALEYGSLCHVLQKCYFIVTDSGGIQEEAATLGIPTVVCRETTERPEAVEAKIAMLAGYQRETILTALNWANEEAAKPRQNRFLFGDGKSGPTIARQLKKELQ